MKLFAIIAVLTASFAFSSTTDPATQEAGTWAFQYRKANLSDVTHAYECGFIWDAKSDAGYVSTGHLGTYTGQSEAEFVNIMNTNMTYAFSFTDRQFKKMQPMHRPPKRCGGKIVMDDSWNHMLLFGGGYHNFDNSYYEPNPTLSILIKEGGATMNKALAPWAFNTETGQWYPLRPLHHPSPTFFAPYGGYSNNFCFATEYGLAIMSPTSSSTTYAYSAYSNQWTRLPQSVGDTNVPPEERDFCVAYDLKNRRMIWLNGNTSDTVKGVRTWAYDVGTKKWTALTLRTQPTRSLPNWYGSYGSMAYDKKNASLVYLHSSGAETWVLHSDSTTWTKRSSTANPPSCGNMGEGMTYDPKRNVIIVFTNQNDEIWTYKTGNGIANRPDAPVNLKGVTSSSGINLTWEAAPTGTAPVRYRIYRAPWDDNKSNGSSIIPYSYELIDSTTSTSYSDNDDTLKTAETFHSYFVEAVSSAGKISDPSTPAYTRLRVPFGLIATPFSNDSVILRWKPKKEEDIVGYNLYRYQKAYPYQKQMLSKRINTALITSPYFIDSTVRICGSAMCFDSLVMYCVTAVNRLGKESGLSPFATTAPDWPTNLWADTVNKIIHWSPSRSGNIANYRIYGGLQESWDDGSKGVSPIAITADTFWSYASQMTKMCYKVKAFSKMGQYGHFSDVLAIQTKDSLHFGMHKMDFQSEAPVPDRFYDDVPPISAELNSAVPGMKGAIYATPNPFYPIVNIAVPFLGSANSVMNASVYSVNGRLVSKLKMKPKNGVYTAEWNGMKYPSGIYVISINMNGRQLKKSITLAK
ncbi:MAG: T9SS type A sorting domain-containing protein [Fibrobacteres bacterium]|nr:T9SS type A sorting domain-containing protein [Fibrobacterota bacterium]